LKRNFELKARTEDNQLLRGLAQKLGAKYIKTMKQVDTYFDVQKGRLKLRETDEDNAELIYYARANKANSRESSFLTYDISCCTELKGFLEIALGVKTIVEKERELWIFENTRIHLDNVKGLGEFVELETQATNRSIEEAKIEHYKLKKALQIQDEQIVAFSYSDLFSIDDD